MMPRKINKQAVLTAKDSAPERKQIHQRLDEALDNLEDLQCRYRGGALPDETVYQKAVDRAALFLAAEDLVCALLGPRAKVDYF